MRMLKQREIELQGQEIQRSIRRRLTAYDPRCHRAIVDAAIIEIVLLSKELEGEFPEEFAELTDEAEQTYYARKAQGQKSKSLALQDA